MAGLNLTPIASSGRGGGRKAMEDIPANVAETIEEAWEFFSDAKNEGQRLETDPFATLAEAESFLSDARAYAYHRGQGDNAKGRLVVSGNSAKSKDKGKFVARFTVTAYVESETAEAE